RPPLRTDRAGVIPDFGVAPGRASGGPPARAGRPAGGDRDRGPRVLPPGAGRRVGRGRGEAPDPVPAQVGGAGPGPGGPARRGAVPAGGGRRPVGGPIPGGAGVGPGPVAPHRPDHPGGAQPRRDGLPRPPPRAPRAPVRQPRTGGLNSHIALARGCVTHQGFGCAAPLATICRPSGAQGTGGFVAAERRPSVARGGAQRNPWRAARYEVVSPGGAPDPPAARPPLRGSRRLTSAGWAGSCWATAARSAPSRWRR